MGEKHCYERKLDSMCRDELIEKIQNQRLEINALHKNMGVYVHMTVWRGQIIRDAIKQLNKKAYVTAMATLMDRVSDGDALLREKANG